MKYIILQDNTPIVFADSFSHKYLADKLRSKTVSVIAGGDVTIKSGHSSNNGQTVFYVECTGASDIKDVQSRGITDEGLIAGMITMPLANKKA